jgi:hypothetical protein
VKIRVGGRGGMTAQEMIHYHSMTKDMCGRWWWLGGGAVRRNRSVRGSKIVRKALVNIEETSTI